MSIVSEPLGRVLGKRYRLVSALGTGASAHVYLAEDLVLQRRVAVKVLQPALVRDESFLRRFRAEARSVAALNHPHVLRVFDWGEDEDGPYLVLEYLEGGSLFDLLARRVTLSPAQAARVGSEAAAGLAYAHARGLVHRDVKPANLLFDEEGRVRVADFGVARALASAALTEPAGTMVGTARYASPEQAQGQPLDGRSDVYSLALVLYEAVTGVAAFTGDTPIDVLRARIGAPLPHHSALGPLDDTLAAAAASDREVRPDAAQLSRRLEMLADALGTPPPLPLVRRTPPEGVRLEGTTLVGGVLVDAALAAGSGAAAGAVGAATAGGVGAPTAGGVGGAPTTGLETLGGATRAFPTVGPDGEVVREGTGGAGAAGSGSGGDRLAGRRRRRWPWVAAVLVVVAALLAAGAVLAVRDKLFTPSHPVPSLVGKTTAQARRALAPDHFVVKIDPAVHSISVPAGSVVSQSPRPGTSLKQGATVSVVLSSGRPEVRVPSLSGGITCVVATRLLNEAHLQAQCPALEAYTATLPAGEVINWSYGGTLDPTRALYGATIAIAVSKGKPPAPVPSVVGETFTQASSALRAAGFGVAKKESYSTTPVGQVLSATPAPGTTVPYGSTVTLTVSKGPHLVTVPTVVGLTLAQATAALQQAGLTVGSVTPRNSGHVFAQVPLAGQQAKDGSAVTLFVH